MADDLEEEGIMADWSRQGMWCLELQPCHASLLTLIADHNCITKLDALHMCPHLEQLSLVHNRLVDMSGLSPLQHLAVLNLSINSISVIQGLESLTQLSWVNLSGNNIKDMDGLSSCVKLHHLDLSENDISQLGDFRSLAVLKTLLLHGNVLTELCSAPHCLPVSLRTFSLQDNCIEDLTQVTNLSFLTELQQLSVAENPCVDISAGFDYRPYVLCCCPSLHVLDGYILTDSERQQAQWLYQQGYIHHILPGQHVLMVRYLATVCPLTSAQQLQSEQDVYLSRIVSKQHHQQHQQQHSHQWPANQPTVVNPGSCVADGNNSNQSSLFGKGRELRSEKCNPAWTGISRDGSVFSDAVRHKGEERQDLTVLDVAADDSDARSSVSLLESESVYLPLTDISPPTPLRPVPVSSTYLASHHSRLPVSTHPLHQSPSSNLSSGASAGFPSSSPASNPAVGNSPNLSAGIATSSPASSPISNLLRVLTSSPRSNPSAGASAVNLPSTQASFSPAPSPSLGISNATGLPASSPASSPRAQTSPETKYESRERRVIRPFNQEAGKLRSKLAGSGSVSATRPQASDAEPTTHTPRSVQRPATAASQDYDMSLDPCTRPSPCPDRTSATPSPRPLPVPSTSSATSSGSVPAAHVSLIHRVADSKRGIAREQQQAMRHTPPPTSSASSGGQTSHIPTSTGHHNHHHHHHHNQQQLHHQAKVSSGSSRPKVKVLDSNRQAELNKLVKCQQNAERHKDRTAQGPNLSTDSGFQSRPTSDAERIDYGHEGQTAATLIQSMWRGYWAREHSLDVVSVRKEIRARRAEDHIVLLRADLDRHKKLYNEEKRLRTLQMEAIRCLYWEIQQLKSQVQGQGSDPNSRPGTADSTLSSAPSNSGTGSSFIDLQRTAELERTCQSLQTQVKELQQALQSMSSHVFRENSMEFNSPSSTADADCLSTVQVLECHDSQVHLADTPSQGSTCHWSSIPHSLSPYPSEEEEMYFRQVPHHGAPTPPRSLTLQHRGENSVLLTWLPSRVSIDHSTDVKPLVVGYRVYINDQMRGTISSHKTVALVSGLFPTATYKFYIKAASSQGESYESNIVIARLARGSERQQQPSVSSDSDVLPDSDRDHDSSDMVDKRRLRKRESRKHRKVRSPRSEKKLPRASAAGGETTKQGEDGRGASKKGMGEGVGGSSGGGEGSQAAQQQEDSSVGILMQPKLHKHRRQRSKEQSELFSLQSDSPGSTPSCQGEDSRPPSRATPTPTPPPTSAPSSSSLSQTPAVHQRRAGSPARDLSFKASSPALERRGGGDRSSPGNQDGDGRKVASATSPALLEAPPPAETPMVLSETFTVDTAKSFLNNMDTPANNSAGSTAEGGSSAKGQKRNKESSQETTSTVTSHKDRNSPDRGGTGGGGVSSQGTDLRPEGRTHRRTRSRDLTTPTPGDEREHSSTPVLDARRRTNSRPSSPMIFEGPAIGSSQTDIDSGNTELARRVTNAENLIQRLRKSPSPSSGGGGGGRDGGGEEGGVERKSPQHGSSRSRKHSASPDSLPDSSQDETTRTHHSSSLLRSRAHSLGSELDLVSAVGSSKKDDRQVQSLLNKLKVYSHQQESSLRETSNRIRKRSSEEEEQKRPSSGRTRNISESDNDMSSDPGSHLPPKGPSSTAAAFGSDSSGSPSDDSKARLHRHRRSPSDQRPVTTSGYNSDQVTGRHTHSPIIMEGGGSKKGSSNVRRNASFHALPSRPPDSQPSPAPEEMASGGAVGGRREDMTSPQESQGNPRCTIRSRSPSPGRNRQPILSVAQLKRQTSEPRQLPDPRPVPEPGKPAS